MKTKHYPRRGLLAAAGAVLAAPALHPSSAQAQTAGLALVIGNSKYQWEASLPNVKRDAPDIAKRFQALGLKTELIQDAGRDAMRKAIDAFVAGARGANFAALYFAGHGATWGKDTYLVPVDADLANPNAVPQLVGVPAIQTGMEATTSNRSRTSNATCSRISSALLDMYCVRISLSQIAPPLNHQHPPS